MSHAQTADSAASIGAGQNGTASLAYERQNAFRAAVHATPPFSLEKDGPIVVSTYGKTGLPTNS